MATTNLNQPTSASDGNIPYVGATADDNTGSTLRAAFQRVNARLIEIFGSQNSSNVVQTPFVDADNIKDNLISGKTEMTGDVADTDELMVSDDGTIKRADFSVVRDAVFNDVSGDATIAAGGALTIENGAVENAMLADNAVDHDELAARYTSVVTKTDTSGTGASASDVDWSEGAVFNYSSSLTGAIELKFDNYKAGQVIDIYGLTGSQTITLNSTASGAEVFNKVGGVDYDGASSNLIQVVCVDDSASTPVFNYSIATYTSDDTP